MAVSFYRAVDKPGQTIDFLLTEHRDKEAALRFLKKAIRFMTSCAKFATQLSCPQGHHGVSIIY